MEVTTIEATIEEDPEPTMAKLLFGLNQKIGDYDEMHHYVDIEDMIHMDVDYIYPETRLDNDNVTKR